MRNITPGDFTHLAEYYAKYRPNYSEVVLKALLAYTGVSSGGGKVADVGAGTGLWTRMLAERGLDVLAVEPNDSMRAEGEAYTAGLNVEWKAGSAEFTGLEPGSVSWLTMASSFHWVKQPEGLKEFHRVICPGGYLTVLWNPRDIEGNSLHEEIEALVRETVPGLKRVSSGAEKNVRDNYAELIATGDFEDVVFFEAKHKIPMSHERYLGVWRSVNDIQAQAGAERFEKLMSQIEEIIKPLPEVVVPYKTRAWTAQRLD